MSSAAEGFEIGILYGSTYGTTEAAAERIARALGRCPAVTPRLLDVAAVDLSSTTSCDALLVGCSTWHVGRLQDDWDVQVDRLEGLELEGRRVALFGAGDQEAYADTFVDALGILAEEFERRGATIVGAWPATGYDHTASLAQRGSDFVGLALDDDNQPAESEERIERWVAGLVEELGLHSEGCAFGDGAEVP